VTVHRLSPDACTDLTLGHQRGSLSGSKTVSHTASCEQAISIDSSMRIEEE